MTILIVIGVLFAVAAIGLLKDELRNQKPRYKINSRPMLTQNELRFFQQLRRTAPNHYICPQVGYGALLEPGYAHDDKRRLPALRTFNQWRLDFAICNPEDLSVCCIVELDDSSHSRTLDRRRDEITAGAGYHTIRIRTGRTFDFSELRAFLEAPIR
jgi:hypothetical protein